ncbi:hypothetical protein ACN27F_08785 [Solwaraspora sp. WMMB335]|uniref:hypothetical protein n=1 Tax=Solwaraspora sp. WMMB335 TaxID=3404118 RepID=UPI003B927BBC
MLSLTIRRKTAARISIPKMAITMTTRRQVVRRERARDWPIFGGLALPDDLGVLSVDLHRSSQETVDAVVADASSIFHSALVSTMPSDQHQLWLLAFGQPVKGSSRVAAYLAERDRLWIAMQKRGVGVPGGRRSEIKVEYEDGSLGFGGSIRINAVDLPVALEVTRRENAVCLGVDTQASDPLVSLTPSSISASTQTPTLLSVAVKRFASYVFVARGFGQFDDAAVGVEVIASNEFLDTLEPRIIAEGKGRSQSL